MTAKELVELLLRDPKRKIVLARDAEGNRYSYLSGIGVNAVTKGPCIDSVGLEKLTPALKKKGYTEEDVIKDGIPVFVLYPED